MNPARVAARGLHTMGACAASLEDYRLCFDKASGRDRSYGHAHVRYHRDEVVEGVLYRLADAGEILKMDPYERAPWNYGRDVVRVRSGAGDLWAWTYFANPAVLVPGLRPQADYLAHLLAGHGFLSAQYVEYLRTWGP